MVRTATSFIMSFVLLIVETTIIMKIKGYEMIYFDNYSLFAAVLVMNFFLTFAILTNIKFWIDNNYGQSDSQFER